MMDSSELDAAKAAGVDVGRIRDYADEALEALDALDGIRGRVLDLADPHTTPGLSEAIREQLRGLVGALTDVDDAVSSPLNGIGYMLDEALGDDAL
jgi:hypothetical protein